MSDRLKLRLHFDAEAMRRDLQRLEQLDWVDHFVPQNYEGVWSAFPLRAPAGARHPVQSIYPDPSCDVFVDAPALAQCPYFQYVLAQFHCPLLAVRLMKLTPGSAIKPHADHDLGAEHGKVRLHIPVVTNREVDFLLNGEPVVMGEGECWYLRLSDTHSVVNRGETDRVHLVIDAVPNDWLEEELKSSEQSAPEERRSPEKRGEQNAFVSSMLASRYGFHVPSGQFDGAMESEADFELALKGWIPFHVRADDAQQIVQWFYPGEERFSDPFFQQTVQRCLATSFNRPFARETSIETLMRWAKIQPSIDPTAFIFHSSRCGSTLFSQLAAALPGTVVISEAPPVDQVLRAPMPEAKRIAWLRAILSALGSRRHGDERHFFVKFDAWHTLDLPLVRSAFPRAPFVFVYRQPAEVIASQMRMPGMQMIPGMLDPSLFGLDLPGVLRLDREEYCARVLALIYSAAVSFAESGQMTLMNYSELPEAASQQLLDWCGIRATEDIGERLQRVTKFDAKSPSLPFDPADTASRPAPSPRATKAARRFVGSHYERLEALRHSRL